MSSTALYILRLCVTLFLITALVAGALAGVNAITEDRIAAAKAEKQQAAIQEVLAGVTDFGELALTGDTGIVTAVYSCDKGYAVKVSPSGFGGPIDMMVGIDTEGNVLGISIISQTETAGLGAVAAAKNSAGVAFREGFVGQNGTVTIGKGEDQVDGLSGATITSVAIADGVNAALEYVRNLG